MPTGNRYAFRLRPGMRRGLRAETPLPTRLVSNEEFPPLPQTPAQRRVEDRILADAARLAPRLGLSRRATAVENSLDILFIQYFGQALGQAAQSFASALCCQ